MIKYGKTNAGYIRLKASFYDIEENKRWVELAQKVCEKYRQQPRREGCVACLQPLGEVIFTVHDIGYVLCDHCGHLNGLYEDTLEFVEYLYNETGASQAASVYGDETQEAFAERVRSIYLPKAEFMCEAIREQGGDPESLTYADFGAGAGHYVLAMRQCGLENVTGYETSAELVEHANKLHGTELLQRNDIAGLAELAATVDADVITMIFALEHITAVREFLDALGRNKRLKYFYFAVPIFNPSVFFEMISPTVMPRILSVGHTHLFSDRSIDLLCEEFGLKRTADWWFGANAFDLHRTVAVQLLSHPTNAAAEKAWNDMLLPMLDELQLAFDHHKLSSEVHLMTTLGR